MTYNFRIKFILPSNLRIGIDSPEWIISGEEKSNRVSIKALTGHIKDANELVIVGEEYPSVNHAKSAATIWQDKISILFLRKLVGADFGNRRTNSIVTASGLALLGQNVLNDIHGTMIYPSDPSPAFISTQVNAIATKLFEESFNEIGSLQSQSAALSDQERLAFDIYSSSKFIHQTDARFLQIYLALETLAYKISRNASSVEYIDNLIKDTNESKILSPTDKESLIGGLQALKKEPMKKALMILLGDLRSREFEGMSYLKILNLCYNARNKIVHSIHPLPSANLIRELTTALEIVFVDVFTNKYIT